MALVRCILEMGMGVDIHGKDYTSAAKRAVFDALHHSSLGFQRLLGKTADDMRVDITIGIPYPRAVDKDAVVATLPHGTGYIKVVQGGLEIPSENGQDACVIANAAVMGSFDDGKEPATQHPSEAIPQPLSSRGWGIALRQGSRPL